MSVVRGQRPRAAGGKGPKKAAAAKRDWDSTVQDLTVHRATPADILRRREIHKSKNKALAQLELQEKALNRKWKKQKQLDADSMEKRKLTLMREALNEDEEKALSEDGLPNSLGFKSRINSDRMLRLLREQNSPVNSQLWAEKCVRKPTLSQESNVPLTPTTVSPSLDQSVKRKQAAQNPARQRRDDSSDNFAPIDLQRDKKSSLEVLNHMIHEVEHELEEYERCTGREVQKPERNEGLSGFTLSLVNALCRLMRYLKETEMQLHEKEVMRQQQEEMLNDHRELIDALTAEVLLVREENITMQRKLQQYMTVTDEKLMSLTQAFKGLPLVEPGREQSSKHFGIARKGPPNNQEKPNLTCSEPRTDAGKRENMLTFPQEELPFKFPPGPGASGGMGSGRNLPAHMFQPAVLLSPPQQKSSQELSSLQNVFTAISQSPENTEREPCKERSLPSSLKAQSTTEENCLISQRQPIPTADKDLESSHKKINLPCSGDTRKNSTAEELFPSGDLLGQIAELTRQNALIKAQLSKFRGASGDTNDCPNQPDPIQNAKPSPDSSQGQTQAIIYCLENERRRVEVSVPVAVAVDSSKDNGVSPASVTSMGRSVGDSSKPSSPPSATSESVKLTSLGQRPKSLMTGNEKQINRKKRKELAGKALWKAPAGLRVVGKKTTLVAADHWAKPAKHLSIYGFHSLLIPSHLTFPYLHSAYQNQRTGFTVLCNDTTGERMGQGGEAVQVTVTHKDKRDCAVKPTVCDNGDGTYCISYSPEEPGLYAVCVCV
ncbi:spindle and centriole associated protein 1 [Willisornis vidua]|uniref:Spindle and centriole-associated protein 1 n=1 Tax=Willisornis vidua TaxID=1566151 RepID=A0ABQ9CKZ4_9PASS|nr:spindle and centriole associated protein 1 [Willisornis vidua]